MPKVFERRDDIRMEGSERTTRMYVLRVNASMNTEHWLFLTSMLIKCADVFLYVRECACLLAEEFMSTGS